ncbi:MAG: transporter substrate-binding domain-containing protein, partial [Desulfobacterales bacterium]|nr:transporter substrate-binding domain-containing protein [Desulfobacterales bacterium]
MSCMFRRLFKTLFIVIVCLYPFVSAVADDKLVVATKEFKPFVMKEGSSYKGFSIDLWKKINSITGYDYKFVETSSTPELLNTIKAGKTDFGVAGISL